MIPISTLFREKRREQKKQKKVMFYTNCNFICSILFYSSLLFFIFSSKSSFSEIVNDDSSAKQKEYYEKKLFLSYDDCLALSIHNNFELKATKANTKISKQIINQRLRQIFPSLSLSYSQTEEKSLRSTDSRYHKLSLSSEMTIYDSGKKFNNYKIAKLQAILARNDYDIELNNFIYQITSQYFSILEAKKSIAIYQNTLSQAKVQESFTKKELDLGEATIYDLQEINNQVKEVELNLAKAKDSFQEQLNSFKMVLNINRKVKTNIIGNIEKDFEILPINNDFTVDTLISIALRNRKEIEQTELEYKISKNSYFYSKYYFLPEVTVGGSYDLTGDEFLPREKGWGVSVTLSSALLGNTGSTEQGYSESNNSNSKTYSNTSTVNILDNMEYKQNKYESKIDLKRKHLNKKTIRNQVELEIETAFNKVQNSYSLIKLAKEKFDLSTNLVKIEKVKVKIGDSRRYDLVEEIIEMSNSEIEYINAITQYLNAGSQLELALGRNIGFLKYPYHNGKENENN